MIAHDSGLEDVYIYIYIHTYIHPYTYTYVLIHTNVHTYIHMYLYIQKYESDCAQFSVGVTPTTIYVYLYTMANIHT